MVLPLGDSLEKKVADGCCSSLDLYRYPGQLEHVDEMKADAAGEDGWIGWIGLRTVIAAELMDHS